ncbi:MAG: hypothetical protein ABIZ34_09095 [Candidatus Limnocylindrales bacterium]
MRSLKMSVLAVVTMSVAAACGSSAVPSTAGTPTIAPTGVSSPTPTSPATGPTATSATATPTIAPTATAAATAGTLDLCSLLTADDLTTVLGGGWLEGALTSGAAGYCHWDSGNDPSAQVVTFAQAVPFSTIKPSLVGGVDMTVSGHAAYSISNQDARLQTTWIEVGAQTLIVEFPGTSDQAADQADAQQLAEIAVGNL